MSPDILPETALATRASVVDIVRAYEAACADIRTAFAMVQAAESSLNATITLGRVWGIHVSDRRGRALDFDDIESTIGHVRRSVWHAVVERLEVRRMLSIARAKELDEQLERGDLPEITEDNVFAFANGYMSQIDVMIGEAIEEVFEFLRPHHSEHKTNTELEIGERVILVGMLERWGFAKAKFHVNHYYASRLTALENVFRSMDQKGAALPTYQSELQSSIETSPTGEGVTTYFAWKGHKNSNLHIRFLRPDLVAKLNAAAGGMRLRPQKKAA